MIGSFLTRGLVMVFGYAYPAYECYKTIERNKPDIEQLRFWCQYWILVAVMTVSERVGDTFISWVPMYSEAKLAFFIYLWYPKTKGTSYVYDSFFRPYVAKHETDIDRNLLELRTRAGDYAVIYCQRAASYGQTRILEILQFVAAQSTPTLRPPQPQQEAAGARKPTPPNRKPSARTLQVSEEPPSSSSTDSLSEEEKEKVPKSSTIPALKVAPLVSSSSSQKSTSALSETSKASSSSETDTMQIENTSLSSTNEKEKHHVQDTVMEEAIKDTHGRLRKNRSIPSAKYFIS